MLNAIYLNGELFLAIVSRNTLFISQSVCLCHLFYNDPKNKGEIKSVVVLHLFSTESHRFVRYLLLYLRAILIKGLCFFFTWYFEIQVKIISCWDLLSNTLLQNFTIRWIQDFKYEFIISGLRIVFSAIKFDQIGFKSNCLKDELVSN